MPNAPAICVLTLGCPKNEVDSERMAARISASAYRLVEAPDDADVVVLNTCAFIQDATEESIAAAFELATDWRPAREGRRFVVAGCLPSRYGAELAAALEEADAFLPVAEEHTVLEVIERLTGVPADPRPAPLRLPSGPTAYLKIADGCDRRCAYCAIPAIRGPFVSEPLDALVAEARTLIAAGAREIVLVGQDITRWRGGPDGRADLAALVRTLADLEGHFRLRLMYLQPDGVTDALLEQMASSPRVCRYLDVPFQHASARVLASMGRRGDGEKALALVERIRTVMPDVVLRTTVMAGFPGETATDFAELESFIAEAAFDYVGVFAYSPEEGTPAAALDGQVRRAVRLRRAQRLRDLADRIGFARAAARVGSVVNVLVEGVDEAGETVGRTCGQAPEVDGVTLLDGRARPGDFVRVRITDAVGYDLVGVVL